jgi:hypothetical protein
MPQLREHDTAYRWVGIDLYLPKTFCCILPDDKFVEMQNKLLNSESFTIDDQTYEHVISYNVLGIGKATNRVACQITVYPRV